MLVPGPGLDPPPPPNWSQAQLSATEREIALNGRGLDVPHKTEGGPGGVPPNAYTVQSMMALERELSANGANALRLAPTQFESSYEGTLLKQDYGLLRSSWGGLRVDFRV